LRERTQQHANGSLLVVEDDADTRDALATFLETRGYEVVLAADGAEALGRLAGGVTPVAVLIDLRMPVMDAGEFLSRKRSDPALAPIPVLLLTGAHDEDSRAAALDATAVIRKPFDLEKLVSAIEACRAVPRGAIDPESVDDRAPGRGVGIVS